MKQNEELKVEQKPEQWLEDHAIFEPSTLSSLWSPDLDSIFRRPERTGVASAWYGHIPFAGWCMSVVRPRIFVELGTHNGVSYSAFCQAALEAQFDIRCYAVDTWK